MLHLPVPVPVPVQKARWSSTDGDSHAQHGKMPSTELPIGNWKFSLGILPAQVPVFCTGILCMYVRAQKMTMHLTHSFIP